MEYLIVLPAFSAAKLAGTQDATEYNFRQSHGSEYCDFNGENTHSPGRRGAGESKYCFLTNVLRIMSSVIYI